MRRFLMSLFLLGGGAAWSAAADFEKPTRLVAGDKAIRVEAPGYACPAWVDLDGDGKNELLVGQFNQGKIQVFTHQSGHQFAPGTWLKAEGKVAQVPGVW